MPDRDRVGLLNTSVVIDLEKLRKDALPDPVMVCAITMAELTAGPAATRDPDDRARRQDRLARAEAAFEPVPFRTEAARAFGRIYSAVKESGRQPRSRLAALKIAAVALAETAPLYTRNGDDFRDLEHLIRAVEGDSDRRVTERIC